jgi:hypothetical protein
MTNPVDQIYAPKYYKVDPLLNSEGLVEDIYKTAQVSMNAEGFYNAAGADISCAVAHPFNKTARQACMAAAQSKTDAKNTTAESEAALNAAIAQKLLQQQPSSNTGKIVLWSSVAVVGLGAIILIIRKMRGKK